MPHDINTISASLILTLPKISRASCPLINIFGKVVQKFLPAMSKNGKKHCWNSCFPIVEEENVVRF